MAGVFEAVGIVTQQRSWLSAILTPVCAFGLTRRDIGRYNVPG